jgi:hypothetical protein
MRGWNTLERKAFVTALGTAGLGLGLIIATAGDVLGALA